MTDKYFDEAANTELPSSEDEIDIDDVDTCSAKELAIEFKFQYAQDETSLSLQRDYILSLCADSKFTRIVAGLSSTAVKIYDINAAGALKAVHEESVPLVVNDTKKKHPHTICGVRFLDDSANELLVGTTNGVVRLFDLRTQGEQARFEYATNSISLTITCFDRNVNSRIICCGTDQYMDDTHLLFYDVRERKMVGCFNEGHQGDVTSVRFHAANPNLICSGGTDGLINVYDIQQLNEDEALQNTINTESSVSKLNWHRNVYEQDIISCITNTNDFMSYECLEGDEVISFERSDIVAGIRRKNAGNFNLINAHSLEDDAVFLLAGTNLNRGEVLRSVTAPSKNTLKPLTNFVGNKQIVRESLYDAKRNLLVTGGECGIITVWTPDAGSSSGSTKLKSKSKASKSHKKTPY